MTEALLHIVTLRHSPETCPAARPDMREKCGSRLMQLRAGDAGRGVTVRGSWADVAGHTFFFLVEAPSAHAISDLVTELEIFHWSSMELRPVVDMG